MEIWNKRGIKKPAFITLAANLEMDQAGMQASTGQTDAQDAQAVHFPGSITYLSSP